MQRKETNYYDIDVDIDETLLKMGLVDDIFYVRDLKQRKLFLTANVDQFSIGDITKHIMQYNAEDKEKGFCDHILGVDCDMDEIV